MNALQQTLYNMLVELDQICEQAEVDYYLAGGTALGAVRNHCFLPWDDDIDLYITRNNWNKLRSFIERKPEIIPDGRDFVYIENTKYYCNPIVRYVNKNTTSIMRSQILNGRACGQALELLVMNPMPKDEEKTDEYLKMLKLYTELVSPYFIVNKNSSIEEFDKHLELYKRYSELCDQMGKEKVLDTIRKEYLSYPEEDCERFCMLWGIDTLIYEKKHYGKGRRELFEDRKFVVGENAEGIFRRAYGDSWMYIPDVGDQVVHVTTKDLNTPFEQYTKQYLKGIDRDKYLDAFEKRKRSTMEAFSYTKKLRVVEAESRAVVNEMHIQKECEFNIEEIDRLLKERNFSELNSIFGYYYKSQMNAELRSNNILLNVGDDVIHYAVRNLIEQGRYYDGNKILKVRKNRGALGEALVEDEKIISFARELSIAIYDFKDIQLVQKMLSENEEKYSEHIDYKRAKLWLLAQNADSQEDWREITDFAAETLRLFEYDGEIMAYYGEGLYRSGQVEEAKDILQKAVYSTRNAFVWEKAKEIAGIDRMNVEEGVK